MNAFTPRSFALLLLVSLLIGGCSLTPPQQTWQHKSHLAYQNFQTHYLENRNQLAGYEFKRAIEFAKRSANLEPLARIYLSECALHHAVLIADSCADYQQVAQVQTTPELQAYYQLLQGQLSPKKAKNLPKNHQAWWFLWQKKAFLEAENALFDMPKLTSRMVAAATMREQLSLDGIRQLIQQQSDAGYRKGLLQWLSYLQSRTTDPAEAKRIKKTLQILQSPTP